MASRVGCKTLECVGGNGYVEESILPRLYREAPLNAIWEGAGNVIALDVMRALRRSPESGDSFIAELDHAVGVDASFDRARHRVAALVAAMRAIDAPNEAEARRLVEALATCWGAALFLRHEPELADPYIRSRLDHNWGSELGTLDANLDLDCITRRAVPHHLD